MEDQVTIKRKFRFLELLETKDEKDLLNAIDNLSEKQNMKTKRSEV